MLCSAPPPSTTNVHLSPSQPPHHHLLPLVERHRFSLLHLKQIHAVALKTSPPSPSLFFLYSRLVLHSSPLSIPYSSLLLLHPPSPSLYPSSFCFNALFRSLSRSPFIAFPLYSQMLSLSVLPDSHTFPFLLRSCAFLFAFPLGSQLHSHIFKLGFSNDVYVSNSLIHFYSSCNHLSLARQVFNEMVTRNRVSWNVIIDAYAVSGHYEAALDFFRQMMMMMRGGLDGFSPDVYTLQSVLCACAGLGALSLGMWAHAFMIRRCEKGVVDDVLVNNSLLDLYSKCGAVSMACQVFKRMGRRDAASWNAMMLGFAMNGLVEESLQCFAEMCLDGVVKPDSITFVAVLSACKHGGLVTEGRRYFDRMVNEFGIKPRLEHFGCIVDILARSGMTDEALEVVNSMDCKPDVVIWRSILDALSKTSAEIGVCQSVAKQALESEELATSGTYVLLSKVYASANQWNDVGLVRQIMTEKGIKKEPGCSSIETDGCVHEFIAGDTSHPQTEEIYEKLREVEGELELVGYKPDSTQAPMVAGVEGVKSEALRLHSERLAIAFGLLNARKGMPIRILKNLRVCGDCHTVTKLISRVYNVEIVVRDRTRFHHFRDGLCSFSMQIGKVVSDASISDNGQFLLKVEKHTIDLVEYIKADYLLIATGSSRQGYTLAGQLGHSIVDPMPSLFTFKIDDKELASLSGVSFPNVKAKLKLENSKKNVPEFTQAGPMLVTHWGLSGPVVLRLSAWGARELFLSNYKGVLFVDFMPEIHIEDVKRILLQHKDKLGKQKVNNLFPSEFGLVKRFWRYLLNRESLDGDTQWASVPNNCINSIALLLKQCPFKVVGKGQFKDEFVTAGGVPLSEISLNSMESRIRPNLFFAGEVLNVDGITGGFNFQNAWSGGYIAGTAIGELASSYHLQEVA